MIVITNKIQEGSSPRQSGVVQKFKQGPQFVWAKVPEEQVVGLEKWGI